MKQEKGAFLHCLQGWLCACREGGTGRKPQTAGDLRWCHQRTNASAPKPGWSPTAGTNGLQETLHPQSLMGTAEGKQGLGLVARSPWKQQLGCRPHGGSSPDGGSNKGLHRSHKPLLSKCYPY